MSRALVLGGLTTGFHQFWINGPAIRAALAPAGFELLLTEDLELLATPALNHYDLVINYTTGRDLTPAQWSGLVGFIRAGKGFVGIHNASDTFKNVPEYTEVLGGRFVTHPAQLDIAVTYVDPAHPIVAGLPPFTVHDELYLMDWRPERVHLLAETRSHEGRAVPVAWVREEGAGRVFYLSLGHNPEVFAQETVRAILGRGAQWAVHR